MNKYKVKKITVKNKPVYRVICPDGKVANDFDHTEKRKADRHCDMLNQYYGYKNDE